MLHVNGLLTSHPASEEVALYPVTREETEAPLGCLSGPRWVTKPEPAVRAF